MPEGNRRGECDPQETGDTKPPMLLVDALRHALFALECDVLMDEMWKNVNAAERGRRAIATLVDHRARLFPELTREERRSHG